MNAAFLINDFVLLTSVCILRGRYILVLCVCLLALTSSHPAVAAIPRKIFDFLCNEKARDY